MMNILLWVGSLFVAFAAGYLFALPADRVKALYESARGKFRKGP